MAIDLVRAMTVEEYLAFEEQSEFRHEYIDGELYEMRGARLDHVRICKNLTVILDRLLPTSLCEVFGNDLRVRTSPMTYVYPDLSVVCAEPETEYSNLTLLNPTVVVEVLSPSSIYRDRIEKRDLYLQAPSIQHYLIIDQFSVDVELLTRAGDDWHSQRFIEMADVIRIDALDCDLPLADVYDRIELE